MRCLQWLSCSKQKFALLNKQKSAAAIVCPALVRAVCDLHVQHLHGDENRHDDNSVVANDSHEPVQDLSRVDMHRMHVAQPILSQPIGVSSLWSDPFQVRRALPSPELGLVR